MSGHRIESGAPVAASLERGGTEGRSLLPAALAAALPGSASLLQTNVPAARGAGREMAQNRKPRNRPATHRNLVCNQGGISNQ